MPGCIPAPRMTNERGHDRHERLQAGLLHPGGDTHRRAPGLRRRPRAVRRRRRAGPRLGLGRAAPSADVDPSTRRAALAVDVPRERGGLDPAHPARDGGQRAAAGGPGSTRRGRRRRGHPVRRAGRARPGQRFGPACLPGLRAGLQPQAGDPHAASRAPAPGPEWPAPDRGRRGADAVRARGGRGPDLAGGAQRRHRRAGGPGGPEPPARPDRHRLPGPARHGAPGLGRPVP